MIFKPKKNYIIKQHFSIHTNCIDFKKFQHTKLNWIIGYWTNYNYNDKYHVM